MTKEKIERHLRSFLWRYERLSLPRIGVFSLLHNSAEIKLYENKIYPPSSELQFSRKTSESEELTKYIALIEGIGVYESQNYLNQYVDELHEGLNSGEVRIGDLGTLIKANDGTLSFKQDENQSFSEYQNLDSYKINPVSRIKTSEYDAQTQSTFASSEGSSALDYWWPFILVAGISVLCLLWLSFGKSDEDIGEAAPIDIEMENDIDQEQMAILSDSIDIDAIDTTQDDLDTAVSSMEESRLKDKAIEDKSVNELDDTKSVDSELVECLIIVGSFKKATSSLRMMNKLEDLGYQVYSEQHGDFTRVGFSFSCEERDLTLYMYEIRKKIAKDAWYLTPEFRVD